MIIYTFYFKENRKIALTDSLIGVIIRPYQTGKQKKKKKRPAGNGWLEEIGGNENE